MEEGCPVDFIVASSIGLRKGVRTRVTVITVQDRVGTSQEMKHLELSNLDTCWNVWEATKAFEAEESTRSQL